MKLHTETVSPELMNLLQKLMKEEILHPFALAGGTALALRFGHRTSVDLDMFTCAAMKLNAITNRGCKKDFWDYAELLQIYSRDEMLALFARKYTNDSLWNVKKSLTYFDDAENDPDPRNLHGRSWEEIKRIVLANNRL